MKTWSELFDLSKHLIKFSLGDCLLSLSLMLFRSLTSGISLLLILPLLQVSGFQIVGASTFDKQLTQYLGVLHVPLHLIPLLILFISLITLIATIHFFEDSFRAKWQENYHYYMRQKIYSVLLNLKWDFFISQKQSQFLHALSGQLQSIWQCHFQLLQLVSQLILISIYFALALWVSWQMTLIAASIAILLLSLMRPINRLVALHSQHRLTRQQTLFHTFYEQLNAFKMVKSCHQEARFLRKIVEIGQVEKQQSRYFRRIYAASKWGYAVGSALSFSVLVYIAVAILRLPQDSMLLLVIAFARLMPRVSSIQQTYLQLITQLAHYASLKQTLNTCQQQQEKCTQIPPKPCLFKREIVFEDITFHYPSYPTYPVISNFSMRIIKNTTTLLLGPSGCGKSTLADLLVGLLQPTQGFIRIDNQPLTPAHIRSWRQSIAYVTQEAFLFNASIRENLQLFSQAQNDSDLWDALQQVSATEFVKRLALGLDTIVGDRGVRLSGGECQRLVLARAILMNPQLLILDESTNALDDETLYHIQQSLAYLHGKLTILVISHQAMLRNFVDQVIHVKPAMPTPLENRMEQPIMV